MNKKTKLDTSSFMVQENKTDNGEIIYELYIPHLGGEHIELKYVNRLSRNGCVIGLSNGINVIEVGEKDDLLPDGLIRQMRSEFGMLLIEVKEHETPDASRYHLLSMGA